MRIENLRTQVQGGVSKPVQSPRQSMETAPESTDAQVNASSGKTTTNAMIMMQKAQSIVSQALSVSSRIKNIAAETLTTGTVNVEEINREVSSIDTQLGQYGTRVTQPPVNEDAGNTYRQIKQEFDQLKSAMKNGDQSSAAQSEERLSAINSNLATRLAAQEKAVTGGDLSLKNPVQLTGETAKAINTNPQMAFAAQGNLNAATSHSLV